MEDKNKKNTENVKKQNNVFTYAVIMLVSVIIIIIIAAMADNRENELDSRIYESETANANSQNEIVRLTNENDELKRELSSVQSENEQHELAMQNITAVLNLINTGAIDDAETVFAELDTSGYDDELSAYYGAVSQIIELIQTEETE